MEIKTVWLNLPVKDMKKSKKFFRDIGFTENPMHEANPEVGSFLIGEHDFVLMLFPQEVFKGFVNHEVSDPAAGSEMLINIDAQSREEVDQMAKIVKKAGGEIYAEPGESQGWMYAFGFCDPDGHRWCMLHMDLTKMPQG